MDFEKLLVELREEIVTEATGQFGKEAKVIVADLRVYLDSSKEKLKKWSLLFVSGDIDKDELAWLLKSQKDLLTMQSLVKVGVSKIKAGHFKNKIISIVFTRLVGIPL
jgi:hypothetical protein